MTPRIDHRRAAPDVAQAISAMERVLDRSPIDSRLRELTKVRASQINGCGYCLDMHTEAARAQGETEQRLYAVSAWHESPFFTDRERAALAWTEAVTDLKDRVPDAVYEGVRAHFSETEIVYLTLTVIAINAWNRLAVSLRTVPGSHRQEAGGREESR